MQICCIRSQRNHVHVGCCTALYACQCVVSRRSAPFVLCCRLLSFRTLSCHIVHTMQPHHPYITIVSNWMEKIRIKKKKYKIHEKKWTSQRVTGASMTVICHNTMTQIEKTRDRRSITTTSSSTFVMHCCKLICWCSEDELKLNKQKKKNSCAQLSTTRQPASGIEAQNRNRGHALQRLRGAM